MGAKCFAKWSPAASAGSSAQSILQSWVEQCSRVHQAVFQSRYALSARTFRWQDAAGKAANTAKSRTMVYLRMYPSEDGHILVTDPSADGNSHRKQTAATVSAGSFDQLLKVNLIMPTASNVQASGISGWIPRPVAISVEGFAITLGDFHIRAGAVTQKGGAASGQTASTIILEIDYLPIINSDNTQQLFNELLSDLLPSMKEVSIFGDAQQAFQDYDLPAVQQSADDSIQEWTTLHRATAVTAFLRSTAIL